MQDPGTKTQKKKAETERTGRGVPLASTNILLEAVQMTDEHINKDSLGVGWTCLLDLATTLCSADFHGAVRAQSLHVIPLYVPSN